MTPSTPSTTATGAWSFDALAGNTAPDSSSPSNRPMALANVTAVAGKVGQAVQFNGTTASGSTASSVLDTSGSFTVATWVRLDALTGWRTMVNQDGAAVSGFWLQYSEFVGNKFLLSMHDADTTASAAVRAIGTTTPVAGQWYHVVGVRDKAAGTMKLYVNGRLEGSACLRRRVGGQWHAQHRARQVRRAERLARRCDGPGQGLRDRALRRGQVAALFNADNAPVTPPTGPIVVPAVNAPLIAAGGTATYTVAATAGLTYSWNFGDGSPPPRSRPPPPPPRCSPTRASTASR